MLAHKEAPLKIRNRLATAMFTAWWFPFSRFGVIHGDPHLGNYTVFARDGAPAGINLLDYGCIRIFPPKFVRGVVDLYHGLLRGDDDRVRSIADGVKPSEYGRREAFRVHQALKQKGPVTVPREFVFMDRAAIGLGAVFLHLRAELNFYRLFNEAIERFSMDRVAKRQTDALAAVGLAETH